MSASRNGCTYPKVSGADLVGDCAPVVGGTPIIRSQRYVMVVTNPPSVITCIYLTEDDNDDALQEETGEFLCLDDV